MEIQEAREALLSMMMKEMKIECQQINGETRIKANCNNLFFPMFAASLLIALFLFIWALPRG